MNIDDENHPLFGIASYDEDECLIWHDGSFMSFDSGPDNDGRGQVKAGQFQQNDMISLMSPSTAEARTTQHQYFLKGTNDKGIDDCSKDITKKSRIKRKQQGKNYKDSCNDKDSNDKEHTKGNRYGMFSSNLLLTSITKNKPDFFLFKRSSSSKSTSSASSTRLAYSICHAPISITEETLNK
jgi:hypothetical protein